LSCSRREERYSRRERGESEKRAERERESEIEREREEREREAERGCAARLYENECTLQVLQVPYQERESTIYAYKNSLRLHAS
jgi:hypothetical protein